MTISERARMGHPYASSHYASLLSHIGQPVELGSTGTSLLRRPIDGTDSTDLIGPYPLTVLPMTNTLGQSFEQLGRDGDLSAVLVSDPFFGPEKSSLEEVFDNVAEFKTLHANRPAEPFQLSHSQRSSVRRFSKRANIEAVDFSLHLASWKMLYACLSERVGITGPSAFPESYFDGLAALPNLISHAAFAGDEVIAMHLWLLHDRVAYSHLTASSDKGRKIGAGHGLAEFALRFFAGEELIVFGGGAGFDDDQQDGLAKFKAGYSNTAAKSLLCGKVLDMSEYTRIVDERGLQSSSYFPQYRGKLEG